MHASLLVVLLRGWDPWLASRVIKIDILFRRPTADDPVVFRLRFL